MLRPLRVVMAQQVQPVSTADPAVTDRPPDDTLQFLGVLSPDGIVLGANPASPPAGAPSESRVLGAPFWETPWASRSTEWQERLRVALERASRGEADRFELSQQTDSGDSRTIDTSLTPVRDDSGSVTALVVKIRDVTARIRALHEEQSIEDRLERAVRGTNDGLWDWNIESGAVWWSTQFFALLGYDSSDLEAAYDAFFEMLHPDDRGPTQTAIDRHLEERTPYDLEFRLRIRSGEYRWFHGRGQAEWNPEGQAIHMAGSIRDIDTRKRADIALRQRDQQLERLVDAALSLNSKRELEAVLREVTDSARRVIDCEYAALGVLSPGGDALEDFLVSGMDEAEVERLGALPTGKGVLGMVITERQPLRLANIASHPASSGFPTGHPKMDSFLGVPIIGRDGAIGNLYLTNKRHQREFTSDDEAVAQMLAAEAAVAIENVRLMSALRDLQESRDRFYAMVNHELRNAITGVYGWGEMFLRKAPEHRAAREVVESAEYALELMNDLLDISRLDAEKIVPDVEELDLCLVMAEAVRTVEPSANENGMRIVTECSAESIVCRTDATRVKQIVINLLRNAIRHSASKDVTLHVASGDDYLEFAVIDQGEGISPEQQQVIFDAYKRADSQAGGGTGLGLSLSARLARLLGGEIAVESGLGEGARFTVTLNRYLLP